jgi:hypothetical protein
MNDEFIGDPLLPQGGFDADRIALGEPGLPKGFLWRSQTVEVHSAVRSWRETGSCRHGSGEQYAQKHWYEIETNLGTMKIYFERKHRGGPKKLRWWLFSIRSVIKPSSELVTLVPDSK